MKILINILILLALVVLGINLFQLDYSNLLSSKNQIPMIGILGSICAILLLLILKNSKKLVQKLNQK